MSEGQESKPPMASFAVGGLQVAVWENVAQNGDGTARTTKSLTLRRSYFSKKDNAFVEQKMTLLPGDLGTLIGLLSEAQKAVIDRRGEAAADMPF